MLSSHRFRTDRATPAAGIFSSPGPLAPSASLTQSPPQAGEIDTERLARRGNPVPLLPLRSAALLGAAVFLDMGLHCLFGVASRMNHMSHRGMSMVCRCFVASSLVMLGGFIVMPRRMREVFRNFFVMSCGLLRHEIFSGLNGGSPDLIVQRRRS